MLALPTDAEPVVVVEGDCLDVLRSMPDGCVDAVVTDPPYDAKTHAGARNRDAAGATVESGIDFAASASLDWLSHCLRVSRRWVVAFAPLESLGAYRDVAGGSWVRAGVWVKTNPMPQLTGDRPGQGCEGVAVMHRPGRRRWNGGGHSALWTAHTENGFLGAREHPTQKPLRLIRELVRLFSDEDELILDPFAGSGTLGVAAMREGRRAILIERKPAYAAIARRRVAEAMGTGLLAFTEGTT